MSGFSLNPIDWVKDAAGGVVDGAFGFLAKWSSDSWSWLAGQLMDSILAAGSVDVGRGLYERGGPAGVVFWLGLCSVIAGLSIQTMALMWRRDAGMAQLTDSL